MAKVWHIVQLADQAGDLAAKLRISPLAAQLLIQRGIVTPKSAKLFLNPGLSQLHSSLKMRGISEAAGLLSGAIAKGEKICVYGDFDVDGITATALLYEVIRELGGNVHPFIPDRFRHGYGLNSEIIAQLAEKKYCLVVTVDNGIANCSEVGLAKKLGLKIIITDHHQPAEILPAADVVVNPKQRGCEYPFKELAGVGVAFKLAQALSEENGRPELAASYLDLVALGTIADIVPLLDENRVLVTEGLRRINNSPRPGIEKLKEVSGLGGSEITAGQVGFVLAPRINAAGRMMNARDGFDLLISGDGVSAARLAAKLNRHNQQRRQVEEVVLKQALAEVSKNGFDQAKAIVLASSEWHDGVKGIVASRLIDRYFKPTILFSERNGVLKGSGRSIPALDLYAALSRCSDLLTGFGGHRAAAGITLKPENFTSFRERFTEVVGEMICDEDLVDTLSIDARVDIADISEQLLADINCLAPFGSGNPLPKFLTKGVFLDGQRRMGSGEHLQFVIQSQGRAVDAVGFKLKDIDKVCAHLGSADVVYQLGRRQWKDSDFLQLRLVDIKLHDNPVKSVGVAKTPPQRFFDEITASFTARTRADELFFAVSLGIAPNIRVVDRRGLNNAGYMPMIAARGQKTLIYARDPVDALKVAQQFKNDPGFPVAFYSDRLPPKLKSELIRHFKSGSVAAIIFSGYSEELLKLPEIRHLILPHPPFAVAAFIALMSHPADGIFSRFVHLLYDRDELAKNGGIIDSLCPGRPGLSLFYRFLSECAEIKSDVLPAKLPDLDLSRPDEFYVAATQIFSELGLISRENNILKLVSGDKKVNLETSPAYREAQAHRADFERWAKIAVNFSAPKLLALQ